ncbi:prephenate dehydratase [Lederbergia citrea]|uniref:prephenate dehydratase n=1 Tax=Lederbergia citrea TaxID=2833581 RepID=UPI001BC9D40E|nr:prephenate dehydratase [Lederbergia citrea]MBS4178923.1 prephenate dehydratase [Lederbergia citrea]MBS4205604.1 prephenate dehydratase [Lederbergia citrea]
MKVAYLGPRGTFSEEAAMRYFSNTDIEPIPYGNIVDVLEAVDEQQVEKGIVPIENAIEGTITMTTDGLVNYDVWIEGEAILPVKLHLLMVKGASLETIKEIWSIPPALAQCRKFTKEIQAETKHYSSTANAAESVRIEGREDVGAVASEWAAKTFDLDIAKRDIHDHECNSTRFLIVSKLQNEVRNVSKSMLLITPTEDRPGLLAIILNVFSSLGVNLTWIESRPTKKKLGTYRFFIEAALGIEEDNLKKAIAILETYGHHVRVLGSYDAKRL